MRRLDLSRGSDKRGLFGEFKEITKYLGAGP